HTRFSRDWSSDVCSSDLKAFQPPVQAIEISSYERMDLRVEGRYDGAFIFTDFGPDRRRLRNQDVRQPIAQRFAHQALALRIDVEIGRASCRDRRYIAGAR